MKQAWWARPDIIFLAFSLVANLALLTMITPFAGGNERMNYQRAVLLAGGHVAIAPAAMPGGVKQILDETDRLLSRSPPLHMSAEEKAWLGTIPLAPDRPQVIEPNAVAVLHPAAYLPQAPVMGVAMLLGSSPLRLFALGRLSGMVVGLGLTFCAIRLAPRNRFLFAAIAMLPQHLFSRSTLDADQFSNGLAFFFLALLLREVAAQGPLRRGPLAWLAASAFLLAQAKSAYLLVPLLAWFIPAERFASPRQRWVALSLLILPGFVGSVAWMLALRNGYFGHTTYETWSGLVDPQRQLAAILHAPLSFAQLLLQTLFDPMFLARIPFDFVSEFGPPVSVPWLVLPSFAWLLLAIYLSEAPSAASPLDRAPLRIAAATVVLSSLLIILTLLYIQWTRYGAPTIDGFHARYLTPLIPLLVILPRGHDLRLARVAPAAWLFLFCLASTASTLWVTAQIY